MKLARLPSKNQFVELLYICVFPIFFWGLFIFFHDLTGYIMHYRTVEIIGILAYVMAFALLESLFVTGILTISAAVLPPAWLHDYFISQTFLIVIFSAIWMAAGQFFIWIFVLDANIPDSSILSGKTFSVLFALILFISYAVVLIMSSKYLRKSPKFDSWLKGAAERFTILSSVFLVSGVLSLFIVVVRNVI